jgi:hypothetical protein
MNRMRENRDRDLDLSPPLPSRHDLVGTAPAAPAADWRNADPPSSFRRDLSSSFDNRHDRFEDRRGFAPDYQTRSRFPLPLAERGIGRSLDDNFGGPLPRGEREREVLPVASDLDEDGEPARRTLKELREQREQREQRAKRTKRTAGEKSC